MHDVQEHGQERFIHKSINDFNVNPSVSVRPAFPVSKMTRRRREKPEEIQIELRILCPTSVHPGRRRGAGPVVGSTKSWEPKLTPDFPSNFEREFRS
jgi:hypothetical protein